jgi:hypothetical protein
MPYVYETCNLLTNQKYIGYCSKHPDASKSYLGSGKILSNAIKKYGKENFQKTILKEFDTEYEARIYEEYLIERYDAINDTLFYNLTKGGYGGWSENAIQSRSSAQTRDKIRNTLTGRKRPEEIGQKIGAKLKGRKQSPAEIENRRQGLLNYYKKTDKSELTERYKKISNALTGKTKSDITKDKLGKLNAKYSDDVVLEIKKMINDNIPYKQITEIYGIGAESITRIKQEKSYKWLWRK